jgi:hypothetical protein
MRNASAYWFPLPALLLMLCSAITSLLPAQSVAFDFTKAPNRGTRHLAELVNGDTIPVVHLECVTIYTSGIFKTQKQYEQWTRLKFNVRKVYPYAILASTKLKEYDNTLESIHNEALRKAFIKQCERDLKLEFEEELKGLTYSQGKLLMKLIDRETGKTTYEIVKQMRGGFQAGMWQAVARVFGHNMKTEYDAKAEDALIERAIKVVEAGLF